MVPRRSMRLSREWYSPCLSCNRNQNLSRLFSHRNPIGWSTTTTGGTDVAEDTEPRATTGSLTTEMMSLGRQRDSSFGSCGPWSMASLMDKLPVTPSPICSPVSSSCSPPSELYFSQDSTDHSSAPKNQIPCIMKEKKPPSPEEVEKVKRELSSLEKEKARDNRTHQLKMSSMNSPSFPKRKMTTDAECFSQYHNFHKPTATAMFMRSSILQFLYEPSESICPSDGFDDDWRLPAVGEEEQDPNWFEKVHPLESGAVNYRSRPFSDSSSYRSSDMESIMEEHLRSAAPPASTKPTRPFASGKKKKKAEAKLKEWNETRTMRLVNKLRKKVNEISEWEKKQLTKAKAAMREYEMKLEKKRAKAMEKMQGKIQIARKEAERRKLKHRASAVKKMAKIRRAFKKIESSGKLPWKLIFL